MYDSNSIETVSDIDLLASIRELARKVGALEADILVQIGEVEERKLYAACAYPSMFAFCVEELGFSEDAVYTRLFVARAARRLPAMIDALRAGQVHLTGLRLLVPHLEPTNVHEILGEAAGKSKRQIEKLVARLAPKPDVPSSIRKFPTSAPNAALLQPSSPITGVLPFPRKPQQHRTILAPLSENKYEIKFTATQALHDKLRRARDLLRHRIPNGDMPAIFERGLDLLIDRVEKERFAVKCEPRARRADENGPVTRYIPAAIRRAVFERDGGRCTFTDERGRRCKETGGLEFDHVDGFARKPMHSVDGVRLRCRAHNQYAAEQVYGRRFMERARARGKAAPCSGTSSQERLF